MSEQRHAVLIGSSEFPDDKALLPPLRCPPNDVDGFHSVLTSQKHGAFSTAEVFKNKPSHEILAALNRVLKRAAKNDVVLIYYSGHGKLSLAGELHLATVNTQIEIIEATSIPLTSIRTYVDASPSNKVVLILDCCYSGKAGSAFLKGGADDQLTQVFGGANARGMYILTASTAVQVAQERKGDRYSLLTKYLLEGIEEGKADFDDDGQVTIADLYKYAHDSMIKDSFQVPMKWALNVQGDDLVLAKTGKARGERRSEQIEEVFYQRKLFRDRYILAGLTAGGALGAGIALFLLRLITAVLFLDYEGASFTLAMAFLYDAALLGAALTFGMALAAKVWKDIQAGGEKEKSVWSRIPLFQSRALAAVLFGAIFFAVAHTLLATVYGMRLFSMLGLESFAVALGAGLGLGLSLWDQPQAGWRLSAPGWAGRTAIAAISFAAVQLPFSLKVTEGTGIILTCGSNFYRDHFVFWERMPQQLNSPALFAILDSALVGILISVFVTFGIDNAADTLTSWLKRIEVE